MGLRPNIVFVFADQWRYQATGFAADPNVRTPQLDRLAQESLNFSNAIAGCPVCCPSRASLLTGQYPLTHGVMVNDVPVSGDSVGLGEAFKRAGYRTGYIGKWHIEGHGRSAYIPPHRRLGFDFWRVQECSHDYNDSFYWDETGRSLRWEGYDALAQTRAAQRFLQERNNDAPFLLVLSWGPPHDPYDTAPPHCRALFDPARLQLRPNVPDHCQNPARAKLAGYYAHIAALDACLGDLLATLRDERLDQDTLLVFWSDHGDMLGSQGEWFKQRPWDESIRVPLLMRWPEGLGHEGRLLDAPIDAPDLMPTLLSLAGVEIPITVQGRDYTPYLRGEATPPAEQVLLASYSPFGQWVPRLGGREYRGLRTCQHTFVRTRTGPWLLYDNQADPYQMDNLVNHPNHQALIHNLDARLSDMLAGNDDRFEPGEAYIQRWGYQTDAEGTVPYDP